MKRNMCQNKNNPLISSSEDKMSECKLLVLNYRLITTRYTMVDKI